MNPAEWVFLRHPDTGGATRVPDEPGVVAAHEARGWERSDMPTSLDPDAPNSGQVALADAEAADAAHNGTDKPDAEPEPNAEPDADTAEPDESDDAESKPKSRKR